MSAFIVSDAHISVLVFARYRLPGHEQPLPELSDADLGQMLIRENHASVAFRYPRGAAAPGPLDEDFLKAFRPKRPGRELAIVELLKAIDCYAYQACEHDGWAKSNAAEYCADLRERLTRILPGYDAAPWAFSADDIAAPKASEARGGR